MRFLAISRLTGRARPATKDDLSAETERVAEHLAAGKLREIYLDSEGTTAYLLLEVDDRDAAEALLAALPLTERDILAWDLTALRPQPALGALLQQRGSLPPWWPS